MFHAYSTRRNNRTTLRATPRLPPALLLRISPSLRVLHSLRPLGTRHSKTLAEMEAVASLVGTAGTRLGCTVFILLLGFVDRFFRPLYGTSGK